MSPFRKMSLKRFRDEPSYLHHRAKVKSGLHSDVSHGATNVIHGFEPAWLLEPPRSSVDPHDLDLPRPCQPLQCTDRLQGAPRPLRQQPGLAPPAGSEVRPQASGGCGGGGGMHGWVLKPSAPSVPPVDWPCGPMSEPAHDPPHCRSWGNRSRCHTSNGHAWMRQIDVLTMSCQTWTEIRRATFRASSPLSPSEPAAPLSQGVLQSAA